MIKEVEIAVLPAEIADRQVILSYLINHKNIKLSQISDFKIVKRSIDARGKQVVYRLKIEVYLNEPAPIILPPIQYPSVADKKRVLIVGAGPAGMFAALKLIELGLKPIIIERGKDVKQRRRDLAAINKEGLINPNSNYCFGEGGAGTYSDGKLYTRSNKRGDVSKILKVFVDHGATEDILVDARPHIGTNKLPGIITSIRDTILNAGGEIHFNTCVNDLLIIENKIRGVSTNNGSFNADAVILATGHSARDIYYLLHKKGIKIEAKPFALGVRVEHPQHIIDSAQYHSQIRDVNLPPAYYSLVQQVDGRGVFSFCMCPGGIIAPCATNEHEIVVNGWSPSKRNNPFANSGIVVQVNPDDVPGNPDDPFKLLNFQQQVEKQAWQAGGGRLVAPAQRMVDFVKGNLSTNLPQNSYLPGLKSVMLQDVLPPFISNSLKKALPLFGSKMPLKHNQIGYYTNEAILVGVESRTSSPVKIPRDKITFQHPQISGLFPCAEGAGYAGGIVSAAIDGEQCSDAVYRYYQ